MASNRLDLSHSSSVNMEISALRSESSLNSKESEREREREREREKYVISFLFRSLFFLNFEFCFLRLPILTPALQLFFFLFSNLPL